jgi:hypothetical protein
MKIILNLHSFVLVWDQAEANRNQRLKCDLTAPFHTFAGECLGKDRSGAQIVIGNAFACMARDTKEVETMMQSSVYNTKVKHLMPYVFCRLTYMCRIFGTSRLLRYHLYSQFILVA